MAFQIRTLDMLLALAVGSARAQVALGIRPEAAIRHGLVSAILLAVHTPVPAVISGFRTVEEQRKLFENVRRFPNASDARPVALRSWHTLGLALDLDSTSPGLSLYEALWRALGGRVGRDFTTPDPGHVDFPLPGIQPPSIFG